MIRCIFPIYEEDTIRNTVVEDHGHHPIVCKNPDHGFMLPNGSVFPAETRLDNSNKKLIRIIVESRMALNKQAGFLRN
jgi:hypothetical protein